MNLCAYTRQIVVFLLALPGMSLGYSPTSLANDTVPTVSEAIDSLAGDIASHLGESERSLAVDNFGGPAGSSTGRLLQDSLQKALQQRGFKKDLVGSAFAVRGSFSISFEHEGTVILIEAQLVDRAGKGRGQFRKYAFAAGAESLEEVAKLFPSNVDFVASSQKPADDSDLSNKTADSSKKSKSLEQANANKQKQAVVSPTFTFQDPNHTRISPNRNSQFHLELSVKRNGEKDFQLISFNDAGGIPFAELKTGDVFHVRVFNLANHPIGIKLLIDGINSLTLSRNEEMTQHGCWLVGANSLASIEGWYIDSEHLRPFAVTAQSNDPRLPDASDIGTVSALIFKASIAENDRSHLVDQYASNRSFPLRISAGDLQANSTEETRAVFGSQLLSSLSFRYTIPSDLPDKANLR